MLAEDRKGEPGQVIQADGAGLFVATGEGILRITSLQLEGKKRMESDAFLRGFPIEIGTRFERR